MKKFRPAVSMLMLSLAFAGGASPAAASPEDCWDKVINWCADAMEDANFIERFAIGEVCSVMIVGCAGSIF